MHKSNCFAFGKDNKCVILKKTKCDNCRFHKTKSQATTDRGKAEERAKEKGYYAGTKRLYIPNE